MPDLLRMCENPSATVRPWFSQKVENLFQSAIRSRRVIASVLSFEATRPVLRVFLFGGGKLLSVNPCASAARSTRIGGGAAEWGSDSGLALKSAKSSAGFFGWKSARSSAANGSGVRLAKILVELMQPPPCFCGGAQSPPLSIL